MADIQRTPINDLGVDDLSVLEQYNASLNKGNYNEATALLDKNKIKNKGIRASIINDFKAMILQIEATILNLTANDDTFYTTTYDEPTDKQMEGKQFWVVLGYRE